MKVRFLGAAFIILFGMTHFAFGKLEATREISKKNEKNSKKLISNSEKSSTATAEYHFSLAQAYASDGDPEHAIEEYKLTLMYDQSSPLIYVRLSAEYAKRGLLTEAMENCKAAIKLNPSYIDAHLILAGLYSASHETELALAEYDSVLKLEPKHEEALIYKSQVLVEGGKNDQAIVVLQLHLKKNPESALAWYYLGRSQQQLDHFKDAVIAYRKAMQIRTGFSQAALALGFLYEEKEMFPQAIETYQELFEDSQDIAAASRLATIYLKEEKYQLAIPFLKAIEAADPEDSNVRVKLGLVYMETKKYEDAIAVFKKILITNPDSDRIHYYLGSLYEETKQVDLAIEQLKKINPESKLYSDAALHTAYLLKQVNRVPAAKSFIQEAITKSPKNSNLYLFQASLEEETKNLIVAIQVLQKAVQHFPDNEKVRYYLGSLYDRQGEVDKSIEQMEAILKLNPENVDALNYIGYTWTQRGVRLSDAEKLLKRALGLRPDNGYIQDSWGWYLFTCGRVQEAVVELEKAVRLKPNEPTILEHLGDAYLRSHLVDKAMAQYKDAARYSDDEILKRKIQGKLSNIEREIAEGSDPNSDHANRMPAQQSEK